MGTHSIRCSKTGDIRATLKESTHHVSFHPSFNCLLSWLQEGPGEWVSLDAELVMMNGEVVGTKNPTGHSLLVDCRFELPFGECPLFLAWVTVVNACSTSKNISVHLKCL